MPSVNDSRRYAFNTCSMIFPFLLAWSGLKKALMSTTSGRKSTGLLKGNQLVDMLRGPKRKVFISDI